MADIETDVLIVGTGPAGSATAALLASYGVANMVVNRYRWLANTPRAHITNQRAMEVLRDLGLDVEAEAMMQSGDAFGARLIAQNDERRIARQNADVERSLRLFGQNVFLGASF